MAKIDNAKSVSDPAPEKAGLAPDGGNSGENITLESQNNNAPEPNQDPASTGGAPEATPPVEQPPKAPAKVRLPVAERPYLDSPRPFGVWSNGLLHRFPKGKTKLTPEQAAFLREHPYVADNGAEVIE